MTRRSMALAALALLSGCFTVKAAYDRAHFREIPFDPAKRIDGCVTIETTPEQDAYAWRGGPTGFTGSAGKLEVPLGMIAREAAVHVLGGLFRGGAARAAEGAEPRACPVVVSPRPTHFAWTAHFLRGATFGVTVHVDARSSTGAVLLSRQYDSGRYRVGAPIALDADPKAVSAGAHEVMQILMLRAAADLRAELARAVPPSRPP